MTTKHQTFVTEMLRHGDKERAYKAAYPKAQGKSITSAANRLLANPLIAAAINETHHRIRTAAEAELQQQATDKLLNLQRVKELLTEIAEGTHTAEKQVRNKQGGYETILVTPTVAQKLAAMRLYCKIEGWQMPAKKATPQPEPKKPAEPNIYLEQFREIRRQSLLQQQQAKQAQAQPTTPVTPQAPLPQPPQTATPLPPISESNAQPILTPKIQLPVPTTGYTYLSELIQDSWDIYIRNQNANTWRRYQQFLKLNNRNLPATERTAIAQALHLQCHPQEIGYYKPTRQPAPQSRR